MCGKHGWQRGLQRFWHEMKLFRKDSRALELHHVMTRLFALGSTDTTWEASTLFGKTVYSKPSEKEL